MPRLFELLSDGSEKKLRRAHGAVRQAGKKGPGARRRTPGPRPSRQGGPAEQAGIVVPDFVAVDLETTGLDHRNNRIIEIGLVRFTGGKPAGEYCTFVNPGAAIPDAITRLTGIGDADVANAPPFADIAEPVLAFIGDAPLCGHQVEFDVNFLNEELRRLTRPKLTNQSLDSASLSRLAVPDLSGYSLSQVASAIGVPLANAHRALEDARASGMVAARLVPRLAEIPPHVRHTMAAFAPASVLKTILYRSVGRQRPAAPSSKRLPPLPKRLAEPDEPAPADTDMVRKSFGENGSLSRVMEGYRVRDAQVRMAVDVARAINGGGYLVAEAGTGVGKSLAYLVPAAHWAYANDARVIVSAYTRNIGDQIVKRDLPVVRQMLGEGFSYSVLKGRANYLCINRWRRLLAGQHGNLSPRERFAILPLIRWAEETETGDIEEQNLFNRRWFAKVWGLISAESHECEGRRCPHGDTCFLQRARRKAQGSHVVVINHALFFSEICAESSFLGRIGPIVFDEAHHLEECGHRHLRVEFDTNRSNRFLESLDSLLRSLQKGRSGKEPVPEIKEFKATLKHLRKSVRDFLFDCESWVRRTHPDTPAAYQIACRDEPLAGSGGLASFEIDMRDLQDCLLSLQRLWREKEEEGSAVYSDMLACMEQVSQMRADIDYLTAARAEDHVFWMEGNLQKGWVKLCGVPLEIGELLADIWQRRTRAAVFTSATLSVLGSIDFFKHKVGLEHVDPDRVDFHAYAKTFSSEQVFRCAVRSPVEPDAPGYASHVAGCVVSLLRAFEKNLLVLFTSNAMLNSVFDALKNNREVPADATILAQHLSGSRQVMLDQFKRARRAALLGTQSFWEGIDAPGTECEIVLVPRLPFLVPTHPLTQALAQRYKERYGDSFRSYSVPEAIIRFRQGAGRLIRGPEDRGALVVLDPRLISKRYGHLFVDSLDGDFVFSESIEEMTAQVARFFG
ncbi:MAG: hypothetical protein GF418_05905 [Chitinivibrionales bacterium]|nr:hypothetical protein [Chitinivibrionales bacterium]MBD3395145.1 hypothetical protein [Chitinivibrionales bacterium]